MVSFDQNSCPAIKYEGAYYDIVYNEDNTFLVWWRKSLVKALFKVNSIDAYRKEVAAMGIIGYHVQQICNHSIVEESMVDIAEKLLHRKNFALNAEIRLLSARDFVAIAAKNCYRNFTQ